MADVAGRQDTNPEHDQENAVAKDALALQRKTAPAWVEGETTAVLCVARAAYSRRAVLAAAYKLSDRSIVLVDTEGEDRWVLYIVAESGQDPRTVLKTLIQELNDQALRDELEQQFGDVRTLIVAHAFSEGNLLDPKRNDADSLLEPRAVK